MGHRNSGLPLILEMAGYPIIRTCDPDDFLSSAGYSFRQTKYGRRTELLIAMSTYRHNFLVSQKTPMS